MVNRQEQDVRKVRSDASLCVGVRDQSSIVNRQWQDVRKVRSDASLCVGREGQA